MKKVIILFFVIFAFVANSFAQTGTQTDNQAAPTTTNVKQKQGHGGKHAGMSMAKELNLTPEQEGRMKDIANTYKGKIKAVRTDNTLDKNQKRTEVANIQNAHEAEVKGILNADQYAKFLELKQQRKENMKARKGMGRGKAR